MAHIVLFHSALGLRPAVNEFAEALREQGHTVSVPDYYEGKVFDDEKTGIEFRDSVGVKPLMDRAAAALENEPDDAVLAGFSLGAFFAQAFAGKRPQAQAAILLHSVDAPRKGWNGVPVQVHRYGTDPWIDEPDVEALKKAVEDSGARFDEVVVPGNGHLFTDLGTPDGNEAARDDSLRKINEFLSSLSS